MKTIETDETKRIWNKVSMNGCNFKIWVKSGKKTCLFHKHRQAMIKLYKSKSMVKFEIITLLWMIWYFTN